MILWGPTRIFERNISGCPIEFTRKTLIIFIDLYRGNWSFSSSDRRAIELKTFLATDVEKTQVIKKIFHRKILWKNYSFSTAFAVMNRSGDSSLFDTRKKPGYWRPRLKKSIWSRSSRVMKTERITCPRGVSTLLVEVSEKFPEGP